jgi:hypothetical protein
MLRLFNKYFPNLGRLSKFWSKIMLAIFTVFLITITQRIKNSSKNFFNLLEGSSNEYAYF